MAIKQCDPDEKNALRWCVQKEDGSRKSRKMKDDDFADLIFNLMGWDRTKRYKIIGFKIEVNGEHLFVFDLNMTESFDTTRKKKKTRKKQPNQRKKRILPKKKSQYPGFLKNSHPQLGTLLKKMKLGSIGA